MGATSRVASSKVALSNVRMEEEEAPAEEKKESVLDSAPATSKLCPAVPSTPHQRQCPGRLLGPARAHVRARTRPFPVCRHVGPKPRRGLDASPAPSLGSGWARRAGAQGSPGVLRCWHRPPEGRPNHAAHLDPGLSGAPAEVLKSLESMTLLEARHRVRARV